MEPARSNCIAWLVSVASCATLLPLGTLQAASFAEFVDPNPAPGNQFGKMVVPLSTGNVVITSPNDDAGGVDAGAVYLFNGATGALISTLRGSTAFDYVGNSGVTALSNGNFVVASPNWHNGAIVNAGAVTWGSGMSGVSGVVSSANSLVGPTAGDEVGLGGVTALSNGNYVIRSSFWDNGAIVNAGAATWGNGTSGVSGVVSSANSLVGSTAGDEVGRDGVIALSNGNYVVQSRYWDNGATGDVGAVTWGSGVSGVSGVVSPANSLVGSTANDNVGSSVTVLTNGNYVVRSPLWDNGAIVDAGAATWASGTSGIVGLVSPANSLVGSTASDRVGVVTALTNGNYVVASSNWDDGGIVDAGAATWGSGTSGITGLVSAANSLVGSTANDRVGVVTALANGNYVVRSPLWDNGAIVDAGAATWASGTSGVTGVASAANSLVGSTAGDEVGGFGSSSIGVRALTNGNYVVESPNWDNGAIFNAGAATWGSGVSGVSGVISAANSLVGSTANDYVGAVTPLANGNYVAQSRYWDNGATGDVGAATWGSGVSGVSGVISAANSLVGSTVGDQVGLGALTPLTNGNYVIRSPFWDNGAIADAGAATWGSGTSGVSGVVSAANSLVGSTANDNVGIGVTALLNGNYVVRSYGWDNGAIVDAGAATWGSGTSGVIGVVSAVNSLLGSTADDQVGLHGVTALSNGNYVVASHNWDNGATVNAGAITWGSGISGLSGAVSNANSLVGSEAHTHFSPVVEDVVNGTFIAASPGEDGGRVRVGPPAVVGIDYPRPVPLALSIPWPNPAQETISFALDLPEGSVARVDLYDIAGRLVARPLGRRWLSAGRTVQSWQPHGLEPGIYHLRAHAGDREWVRRVVWLGRQNW